MLATMKQAAAVKFVAASKAHQGWPPAWRYAAESGSYVLKANDCNNYWTN